MGVKSSSKLKRKGSPKSTVHLHLSVQKAHAASTPFFSLGSAEPPFQCFKGHGEQLAFPRGLVLTLRVRFRRLTSGMPSIVASFLISKVSFYSLFLSFFSLLFKWMAR